MKLGVVIVTWNSAAYIGRCLDALRRVEPDVPVALVDNASADNTLNEAGNREGVLVEANSVNRGFAAGVNQGAQMLPDCDLILVLNPDAVLQTDLVAMVREFDDPWTGACGGRLIGPTGRPQTGFELRRFPTAAALICEVTGLNRIWPSNPVNRRYRCHDVDGREPCDAEQPAGAFLMIRREAWTRAGGFDEGFHPVWFEDVDFLKRLSNAGWRIRFTPGASAEHAGAHSVSLLSGADSTVAWYGSLLRYAVRHCSYAGRAAVALAVFAAAAPRAAARAVQDGSFLPFSVCGRLMRLSISTALGSRPEEVNARVLEPVLPPGAHKYAKLVNSGDRSPH